MEGEECYWHLCGGVMGRISLTEAIVYGPADKTIYCTGAAGKVI